MTADVLSGAIPHHSFDKVYEPVAYPAPAVFVPSKDAPVAQQPVPSSQKPNSLPQTNTAEARTAAVADAALLPDPYGRVHPLSDLRKRIERGDSIIFNNDTWWETIKRILRSITDFFGFRTDGYLDPTPFDGTFDSRGSVSHSISSFFGYDKENDMKLANFVVHYIASFETSSRMTEGVGQAPYNEDELMGLMTAVKARLERHVAQEKLTLKLTENIMKRDELKARLRSLTGPEKTTVTKELKELNNRLTAAKRQASAHLACLRVDRYFESMQLRAMNKSTIKRLNPPESREKMRRWLEESVKRWRPSVKPALLEHSNDRQKMEDLLNYPAIIKLLRKDPVFRDSFYKFVFRNTAGQCPDAATIAAQFPATQEDLTRCFLDKREWRLGKLLTFFEQQVQDRNGTRLTKEVRFKINGEDVSLHDRARQIHFSSTYSATVESIMKSFSEKNYRIGPYETIQGKGIMRVHPAPCDLSSENWYKELPVFETLSRDEVHKRYKLDSYGCTLSHGLIVMKGSRQFAPQPGSNKIRFDDAHGWAQVVMPDEHNPDLFKVYPLGKYADPMPESKFDKFFYIFNTHKGYLGQDENEFYLQREHEALPLDASPQNIRAFFEKTRQDLIKQQRGDLIFQAQGDNCAAWVKATVEAAYQDSPEVLARIKDVYDIEWQRGDAPAPLSYLVNGMSFVSTYLSSTIGNIMRMALGLLCGAWRGYTTTEGTQRTIYDRRWQQGVLCVPSAIWETCAKVRQETATRRQIRTPRTIAV